MTDIIGDELDRRIRRVLRDALSLNASDPELARLHRADALLGLDSIATIEFVLALEEEFAITLDLESLDPAVFADLSQLRAHIEARLRERR